MVQDKKPRGGRKRKGKKGKSKGGGRSPPIDVVSKISIDVLKKTGDVRSQGKMLQMVGKKLKDLNPRWGITAKRLRAAISDINEVRIITHARISHQLTSGNICPVCGSVMSPIKNETLYGWKVTSGYSCHKCGYWTGRRKRIPILYEFIYEGREQKG